MDKNDNNVTLDDLARMVADGFKQNDNHFAKIEKRLERLEARLDGVDRRLDDLADKVAPIQQLEKFITEDVFERVQRLEQQVFRT